jgi:hypothetical protein
MVDLPDSPAPVQATDATIDEIPMNCPIFTEEK